MVETRRINLWNPHKNQRLLVKDKHRFKVIVCGRRFGKTTYAVNALIKEALLKDKAHLFYVAPTYKQAKMIAWNMLVDAVQGLPKQLTQKVNESELYVILGNKSRIDIKGADNPDSLRGVGLDGVVLDEYADMKPNVFEEIIRPALTDKKGWATFIGTPKGFNHFFDLYESADHKENWEHFKFTTYDNPLIDPPEIEEARTQMTEDKFQQEYMAEFRKMEGLVYKEFDRERHIYGNASWNVNEKILGVDFGYTNPTAVLTIIRDNDSNYYVTGEWYKTGKTNIEIIEYCKSLSPNAIYPDPAEPDRINEMERHGLYIREVSKDIAAGIDKVRELFKANKLKVHESCKNLIWELETYRYPEKKDNWNEKEVPVKENDHAVDALRYALYMNAPLKPVGDQDFKIYSYDM